MHDTKHSIRSEKDIDKWRGDISLFRNMYSTEPYSMVEDAGFFRLLELVCGERQIIEEKEQGRYFIPTRLRIAELVGETRRNAEKKGLPTVGFQRSRAHVTTGSWVKLDADGITEEQFDQVLKRIASEELAYIIYSTHSHGRADKPGVRCRMILFLDEALESDKYEHAAKKLGKWLLPDGGLDESSAKLWQQAGVYMVHPERIDKAFRRTSLIGGYCCSTATLLSDFTEKQKPNVKDDPYRVDLPDQGRLRAALQWIDPNSYDNWIHVAFLLKAAYGEEAFPLWLEWGLWADEQHRGSVEMHREKWETIEPRISAEQGLGKLFQWARDEAMIIVKHHTEWNPNRSRAVKYIYTHHRRFFHEHFTVDYAE